MVHSEAAVVPDPPNQAVVEFEDFFSIIRKIMSLLGLHLNFNRAKMTRPGRRQNAWFWFVVINLSYGTLGSWVNFYGVDFMSFTYQSPLSAYATCGLVEVMLIWWNKDRISRIFCELNDTYQKYCMTANQQPKMRIIFADSRRFIVRFIICFVIWVNLFNLIPIYVLVKDYQLTGEIHLQMPYIVKYPFDPYANRYLFPVLFINENLWGLSVVTMVVLDNLTLGSIVTQLRMHFNILEENVRALGARAYEGSARKRADSLYQDLGDIIQQHQKLIELTDNVADVFSVSLLSNYFFNSFIICMALFQIVFNDKYEEMLKFSSLLICVLLQTMSISYYGHQITERSFNISNAAYECNWEDVYSPKFRKSLVMVMMRAFKSQKFTAARYITISMPSFTSILSSAYTYFALLNTMFKKSQTESVPTEL